MKKIRSSYRIIFSLAFLLLSMSPQVIQAATRLPEFSLQSVIDGKVVESASFDGKVLLITFFATWCPPCAQEVPALVRLQEDLEQSGFSVIGMSVDQQGPAVVSRFVADRGINYPVLLASRQTTVDFGGIYGIPVAFLVNKSGQVVKKYTGFIQHSVLEKDISSLLN
jgi:thiol-disulfide isomerase/thioredoxin